MNKTKIIHIIGRLEYGGAERLLLDLAKKIDRDKFDLRVLSLAPGGRLLPLYEKADIEVKIIAKKYKGDFSVIPKVKKYLQQEKPDIVHTHLFIGDFWGGIPALLAKVPVIISTKHDILTGGFGREFLSRLLWKKFTKVVAISKAAQDYLFNQGKLSIDKIHIIYNGVDVGRFFIEEPTIFTGEKVTIGSVGRLCKIKGHKHLIRSCRFLKNKNWQLLFVGDGPLRSELERQVQMLDLEEQVTFVGEVEDVRPYLDQMDVFVLPSVSEGLSLAILEAAVSGRFIISTNVGGVGEIITDKEDGLLFKPKNIEQLVAHLNWMMENKNKARQMASRLQKKVIDKFDLNKTVLQYQELYQQLAQKRNS